MKLSLGKFALEHCDLPTMLDNVAIMLRMVTINIDKHYTKRIPLIYYFIVFVAAAGYIYIYIFSMFWFVFVRCRETGDFTAAAVVFSLGTNSETCATKLLFMVINKDKVQGMVQRYLECDSKVVPGSRFSKNLLKKLRGIKRRVTFVWSSLIIIGLSYVLCPFVLPGRHFTEDMYVIYGLEPMIETPNYEIASIFMTITICTGIYTLAGVTAFILVIIGYIEAQMLTLSDEMITLWEDAEKHYEEVTEINNMNSSIERNDHKMNIVNKYINNRLKEIVTFHIADINLLNDFEAMFRVTMAIEFVLIVIGIVSELLGRIENTYIELPYTFLQIYMDCYVGQKLIDASNIFEKAIYDCKWENFDKKNMKIILIMLQNSQKSLKLTAGGLTKLDFVCLMSVIKNTYSFYTTLQSTGNKSLTLFYLKMKIHDIWAVIRTFSLTEDNFLMMIENVAFLMRTMTIKIYKNDDKSIPWLYYFASIVGGICYFYVYIFSAVWLVFFRFSIAEDFIAMTVVISLTTCSVTSITKILFMKFNESHIQNTIEKYITFDKQIVQGTRLSINLRKYLRVVKKRALFMWIILVANVAIYMLIPFLRPGRHFTQDLILVYGLEPMLESPNYEIVHTLTIIGITYGAYVMVNVAVYVIVIVGYNEAQLYAISEELKNLWVDGQSYYNKVKQQIHDEIYATNLREEIVNEYILIRLKTIVFYHVTNVNLFKVMNNNFSDLLVIEYSVLVIAVIAELLGGLENTYLQVPYTIVQISMDCLSGQRLINACHELENALYSCEWENFNVSNQKAILLMLLISQKTLMLSAGGMADLNFSCLMIIFKSSYSAYTTLKSSIQH